MSAARKPSQDRGEGQLQESGLLPHPHPLPLGEEIRELSQDPRGGQLQRSGLLLRILKMGGGRSMPRLDTVGGRPRAYCHTPLQSRRRTVGFCRGEASPLLRPLDPFDGLRAGPAEDRLVRMRGLAWKAHVAGLLAPLPAFGGTTLTCASPVRGEGKCRQTTQPSAGRGGC